MRSTQYSVHVRVLVLFPPPQVLSQDDQERQGENSGGPENKSFRNWSPIILHEYFMFLDYNLSMKGYKIKFVTHRLPHCRLLSQKCGLEGDLYSRMCMIVFLTYFHLRMTHYKMTIQSMLKALKIQFLWGWRKGQKWVRSPLSTVKQLLKSNVTPLYHSLAWEFLQIFESGHSIELQSQVKLLSSIAFQEMVNVT